MEPSKMMDALSNAAVSCNKISRESSYESEMKIGNPLQLLVFNLATDDASHCFYFWWMVLVTCSSLFQ